MPIPLGVPFYAALLDRCYAARDLRALRHAHARILAIGLAHHDFLRSKLCAAYARCARLGEAHRILARANRRPAFLYNALIRSYAALRAFPASLSVLRSMRLDGAAPTPATLASALRSAAALPSLRLGRLLHAASVASGLAPDPAVSNSLVSMYSRCGDLPSARHVFDALCGRRNLVSYTAMIAACGAHGLEREAVALFDEFLESGRERPDAAAVTAVLAACAHGGLAGEAERVFGMVREGRFGGDVRPSVEHYTCMVDMLGRAGRVEEAEKLVGEMEGEPDDALWGALLGACRAHGRLDVAQRVAERAYGKMGVEIDVNE